MWRGRSAMYVIVDDCLHEVMTIDDAMRKLSEKLQTQCIEASPISSMKGFRVRHADIRQQESNDWRRKGKRGFNGYHRYV